ncbi:MAG: cyclic nucleotide-binding domain-containing protein [Elusimicrobia bacterium]|nr:cyclic nucleotide-binding domain-containing protein [Elusimicrobiota bacterium]
MRKVSKQKISSGPKTADKLKQSASRLHQISIFSDLTKEDLLQIARIVSWRRAARGSRIFQEGDAGSAAYLIEKGRVVITKKDKNNEDQEIAMLSDGDFFGEMSLLDMKPRSATARTTEDSLIIEIKSQELFAWAFKDPKSAIGIGLKVVRGISERLRETTQELTSLHNLTEALLAAHDQESAFRSLAQEFSRLLTPEVASGAIIYGFNPYLEEFVALEHWGDVPSGLLVSRKELPPQEEQYRIFPVGPECRQGCLLVINAHERRLMKLSPLIKTFAGILNQALLNIESVHDRRLHQRLKNRSIVV